MISEATYLELVKQIPALINPEFKNLFINYSTLLHLKKGAVLIDELKANNKTFIILKGSCIQYIITPDGQEKASSFHTESFMPLIRNQLITNENSIVNYEIKLNENSDIIAIEAHKFIDKIISNREMMAKARDTAFENLSIQNQIQNHLIGLTKEDFLKWFLENYGFIFQRFAAKDIASFMGVSPTWLSLLKKKMAQKQL